MTESASSPAKQVFLFLGNKIAGRQVAGLHFPASLVVAWAIINVFPLSSNLSFLFALWNRSGPFKHLSFVSWPWISVDRGHWCDIRGEEGLIPSSCVQPPDVIKLPQGPAAAGHSSQLPAAFLWRHFSWVILQQSASDSCHAQSFSSACEGSCNTQ